MRLVHPTFLASIFLGFTFQVGLWEVVAVGDLNDVTTSEEGLEAVEADGETRRFVREKTAGWTVYEEESRMTDKLAGKDDSQRLLGYVESVAKESRKALTLEFNEKHKGIPFNKTGHILRDSLIAWFGRRDKNLKIIAESVNSAKLGEVRAVFGGETKNVRFKVRADATFSLAGGSAESPCYLKELNVSIDRHTS